MKRKALVILGSAVASLALLWVAGSVVAGPLSQGPIGMDEGVRTATYDPTLYPRLPREMNYQGVLRDENGNPIDGSHDLTFTIYRKGFLPFPLRWTWTAVYSETQNVQINNGLFNVVIGSEEPLDPGDFDGITPFVSDLELGVKVDGGDELTPRVELLPVPYAFRAEYVNRFPAPHYKGNWYDLGTRADPIQVRFTHNLGGDPDDYVVDLECKGTKGTHQCLDNEAYWHDLTDTTITVWATSSSHIEEIRVRIWRID